MTFNKENTRRIYEASYNKPVKNLNLLNLLEVLANSCLDSHVPFKFTSLADIRHCLDVETTLKKRLFNVQSKYNSASCAC